MTTCMAGICSCCSLLGKHWIKADLDGRNNTQGKSGSAPLLSTPLLTTVPQGLPHKSLPQLMGVVEDEEVISIDGNPAGLQRLVHVLVHNMGGETQEDPDTLGPKLKKPYASLDEFTDDFRQRVHEKMTANDFRQMMYILESIFAPLRAMTPLSKVMDIFMNQWYVKVRPVAMNLELYKNFTKRERENARSSLDKEERDDKQKYDMQYRLCKLRSLMDDDNNPRVVHGSGDPLSVQAVNWTKCIVQFMCSIFNLYLKVCPAAVNSISQYLTWVESTGVHKNLPPPHQIFGDSNLRAALPAGMRMMVTTALRATRIGPKEIFSASMTEVFGDSIQTVRMFLDNLRAIACLLEILLQSCP